MANGMSSTALVKHGHYFAKKNCRGVSQCNHCTEFLWGILGQGRLMCKVCCFAIHDKCLDHVTTPCTNSLTYNIKNPTAHCWSISQKIKKKKICNVCRGRLEGLEVYRCEVCEYFVHVECKVFAVSNCKQCATYTPNIDQKVVVQLHHWREGNLPRGSKCAVCTKACYSGDFLTGCRCEWCGITAHSNCQEELPLECFFGLLKQLLLPTSSLTVPRMDFLIETLLSFVRTSAPVSNESAECSSAGEGSPASGASGSALPGVASPTTLSAPIALYPPLKSIKDKGEKDETAKILVYDGDIAIREGVYRVIYMAKNAAVSVILDEVIRVFYMPAEPIKFYLSYIGAAREIRLDERYAIVPQVRLQERYAMGPRLNAGDDSIEPVPSLCLRRKEKERGELSIYIDGLLPASMSNYADIPVTRQTNAHECTKAALDKFGLKVEDADDYEMVTVLMDKAVIDRKLEADECPFRLIQLIEMESLWRARMTRFYIQLKKDPHGSMISIFVGNLPVGLSQRQYKKVLINLIGRENLWTLLEVIYYEYGSLVIVYDSRETAAKVFKLLQNASYDDKSLQVMLLPNIQTQMLSNQDTPLLVFVNTRSGGCQGQHVITGFRKILNPHQVFDLSNGGPLPGLYVFRHVKQYKLLVCGGDGTVGWVLQCLDNVGQDAVCDDPPIAILPLGTGNDLARVLRWGPGFTGGMKDLQRVLKEIIRAENVRLDRWAVVFHIDQEAEDSTRALQERLDLDCQIADTNEENTQMYVMNNYMGIGIDAELSHSFHNAREKNPDKFNSRVHNKGVYFKMSVQKIAERGSKLLSQTVNLYVDGCFIELPQIEGIIILNILSWASGAKPWGTEKESCFMPPNHHDGLLEVVGVTGVVHMGKITGGISSAKRLAQGKSIRIEFLESTYVHIDGEPWSQPKGYCSITKSALKATMLKKAKSKVKRRDTQPALPPSEEGAAAGAVALPLATI